MGPWKIVSSSTFPWLGDSEKDIKPNGAQMYTRIALVIIFSALLEANYRMYVYHPTFHARAYLYTDDVTAGARPSYTIRSTIVTTSLMAEPIHALLLQPCITKLYILFHLKLSIILCL